MNYVYKCKYRSGFKYHFLSVFFSVQLILIIRGFLYTLACSLTFNPHVDPCVALWPVVCRHKLQSPRVDLPDSDGTRPSSAFLVPLPACSCPFCSQLSATFFRCLSFLLTSLCKAARKRSADVLSGVPQGRPGCAFRRECSVRSASFRHEA